MEVHHHSHAHGKKTWKGYFWEFLMLFLAVFCGFLAENEREHLVERHREKQYIRSMTVDLATDTSKLGLIIRHYSLVTRGLDSILLNFDKLIEGRYSAAFMKFRGSLDGFTDFIYTDRTIEQLKSSGSMRLIRKQVASDSIVAYDDAARDFLLEQEGIQRIFNRVTEQQFSLINYRYALQLYKKQPELLLNDSPADLLLTHDKEKLEGFYNSIYLYRNALYSKKLEAGLLFEKAVRLIGFLKSAYHLN